LPFRASGSGVSATTDLLLAPPKSEVSDQPAITDLERLITIGFGHQLEVVAD
jgi:hypothetical protein